MERKKLLLCGATGFIGKNLLEHFSRLPEYDLFAIYHHTPLLPEHLKQKEVHFLQADLTDKGDLERIISGMDIVIQAAATTSGAKDIVTKPYHHVTDNAVMNSLLLRACYERRVKHFLFFSCTVMYQEQSQPVKEEDFDYEITDKYFGVGWTKVYLEKMCEFYSKISDTKFTVIRHSNIYGPHDKYDLEKSHVFGATVAKVMTARDEKIVVWGEGSEERDLLYVDDLVHLVELVLRRQNESFELLNVGSGESISVLDLVRKIIYHSGKELQVEFDRTKPTLPFKLAVNFEKAKRKYGWRPQVSLDEGIMRSLEWYRQHHLSLPLTSQRIDSEMRQSHEF